MKNLLFVAFAAIAITACQKEMDDNRVNASTGEIVTFTASVDNALTKTAVYYKDGVESFNTLFTSDDKISVNGVKTEQIAVSDDRKTIEFSVEGVTGPYYAITAAHDKGYDPETQSYSIQYSGTAAPQKYRLVADGQYASYWSSADILAACGDSQNLQFKHMTTFYAITINKADSSLDSNIKSIYIRQGNGGNIAGSWKLSFEDNSPKLTPATLSALIGYDCGEEGVSQDATMIVGLPAYNYEEGLIFTIKDVNGNFASYKVPASKTQHAADGGMIIPFKPAFKPASGTIKTVEDWEAFAAAVNSSNDWDLYRWVGDGTVKLGANIEAENLTTITKKFPYVFDGCGYTITRTAATRPLFLELSGEIKNLTLAGKLTLSNDYGAPFVRKLNAGSKLTGCTNRMSITCNIANAATYVAGIAAYASTLQIKTEEGTEDETEAQTLTIAETETPVTTISQCYNYGSIEVTADYSSYSKQTALIMTVGGIIADVRAGGDEADGYVHYSVNFDQCKNFGDIKVTPIPHSDHKSIGMGITGLGGVVGFIRSGHSFTLNDCDNEGDITLSAEQMKTANGMKAYSICMGGVLGLSVINGGLGVSVNGNDIELTNCDNSGTLYNCGDNYSGSQAATTKVYTAGIAGALVGLENDFAVLKTCTNTGDIYTYDLVTGDQSIISGRTPYNPVAGGLVGFGAYLDMDGCTVDCTIGNGKRQMYSWGGMIGYAATKFHVRNNTTLNISGYSARIANCAGNIAIIAAAPVYYQNDTKPLDFVPALSGSTITGTLTVSGSVKNFAAAGTSATTSLLDSNYTELFTSQETVVSNLVCGMGYTTYSSDVSCTATINYSAN